MSYRVKHLRPRNGIYYYSRRLPQAVLDNPSLHQEVFGGGLHYRVSLRTSDQVEALGRFQSADAEFKQKLSRFSPNRFAEPCQTSQIANPSPLTAELLTEIKERVFRITRDVWLKRSIAAEISPEHAELLEAEVEYREQTAAELKLYLSSPSMKSSPGLPDVDDMAQQWAQHYKIRLDDNGRNAALIKKAVRGGLLLGERAVDQMLEHGVGDVADLAPSPTLTVGPLLSEIFESYLAATTHRKTRLEASRAFREFTSMVGNIRASNVAHKAVLDFCKSEGSRVVGSKGPNSIQRPISAETVKKSLSFIRSAFERAISRGEFDGANPVGKINVEAFIQKPPVGIMGTKRPLRTAELAKLFASPWFTGCEDAKHIFTPGSHRLDRMHYWVPVIAALTGMRLAEIAGLKISEVKIDDRHPHIEVRPNEFRSQKSDSVRLVPIIRQLDELGFSNFVRSRRAAGDTRVFEDIVQPGKKQKSNTNGDWGNASLFRKFNEKLLPQALGLPTPPVGRKEVSFHGLRGSFKTMLSHHDHNISDYYIDDVIGHAKQGMDKPYRPEIALENLYSALVDCRYKGFEFPRLPNS